VYQACVEAFYYMVGYAPAQTSVVSLGTGRFASWKDPRWLWPWLGWVLGELLRSPGEQQTELVQRHFSEVCFYRLDTELPRDIPLDGVGDIDTLRQYGERFAASVDWNAILSGTDMTYRVTAANTLWRQYRRPL